MVKIGNQYHFTFMVHEDKIDKSWWWLLERYKRKKKRYME
jgi:hypothetical protein